MAENYTYEYELWELKELMEEARTAVDGYNVAVLDTVRHRLVCWFEEALAANDRRPLEIAWDGLEDLRYTRTWFVRGSSVDAANRMWPDDDFALLVSVMQDERFHRMKGSWHFLHRFASAWDELSVSQQERLYDVWLTIYDRFDDWMACFTISEILGEHLPSERTLAFFNHFIGSENETARTFVPHGFEHAIQNSKEERISEMIWQALRRMESDSSPRVRGEVAESYHRLANHGLRPSKNSLQKGRSRRRRRG